MSVFKYLNCAERPPVSDFLHSVYSFGYASVPWSLHSQSLSAAFDALRKEKKCQCHRIALQKKRRALAFDWLLSFSNGLSAQVVRVY